MKFFEMFKRAVATRVYAVRSFSADPLQAYKFQVSISGVPSNIGFTSVSGLSRELEVVEYLENMYDYAHKFPGREKVNEITFERGMYAGDESLWDVYKTIFQASSAVRRDVTINVTDRWGVIRRSFQLTDCWFSKLETGDFDAESNEVLLENLTMQFEKFL